MDPRNSPRKVGWIQAILLGLLFSGCAGFRVNNAPNHDKDIPKKDQRYLSVPFFPDNTDQCGPSVLSSVFNFWGTPMDPSALKEEIYLAHLKGSLPMDLLLAAENHGFKAHLYSGSIDDLKSELKKGHPLVAFINRGFNFYPIGHYVVINGFDDNRQGLYVHSGEKENRFVTYKRFLRDWNKTHRSTLLVLPPEQDVAAIPAHITAGNTAFANREFLKAEASYHEVLRLDPNDAGANNNLAMVYMATGKDLNTAEQFIHTALKQTGPLRPYVLETLADLYIRQGRTSEARRALDEAEASPIFENKELCDQLAKTRENLAHLCYLGASHAPNR